MNNSELSYKLNYILKELGMNKTEFLKACRVFNPSISKPTILNAINGKNTIAPTIETLSTIIKVCQTSKNKKLKHISYDFLLNDNIKQIEANNVLVYQEIGLSDNVIDKLKQYNHPFYYNYHNIINYYLDNLPTNYFKYDLKKIIKYFNNDSYLEYIERNFRNIYDYYLNIKNKKEINKEQLLSLLKIIREYLIYQLLEINKKLYEMMDK